jgi:hypothetical protein
MMTVSMITVISLLILCFLVITDSSHARAQKPTQEEDIIQWIARLGEGLAGDNNEATEALIKIGQPAIPYLPQACQMFIGPASEPLIVSVC